MPCLGCRLLLHGSLRLVVEHWSVCARIAATTIVFAVAVSSSGADVTTGRSSAVQIHLRAFDSKVAPVAGKVVLRSIADSGVIRDISVTEPNKSVSALPGSSWEASFVATGWWSPSVPITFPAAGTITPISIPVWKTGVVRGTVVVGEPDITLPKTMTLTVESPPIPSGATEINRGTTFECPVGTDGKWSCEIPATVLDLVVRQKGITPMYRWGVAVSTATPRELGTFTLKRGASLTAWLDRVTAKALKSPAQARLVRNVPSAPSQTTMRLAAPVAEAAFNPRGAVQLAPVPPGSYMLEVSAPGYATARVGPIEIYPRSESVYRKAIELHPPMVIAISIDPPLNANDGPWRARWGRYNDVSSGPIGTPSIDASANREGVLKIPGQSPGSYNLALLDEAGNQVLSQSFAILSANDATLHVTVDLHPVRGTIKLGSDPIAATIWFGGMSGSQRVKMISDAKGAFQGSLPRMGLWPVEVSGSEPAFRSVARVTVKQDEPVKISLPDNRVTGWVIGPDGGRLSKGTLLAASTSGLVSLPLAPDGSFDVRALSDGTTTLSARTRSGQQSAAIEVQLTGGVRKNGIELRIEPVRDVTGNVVSRGASVIGALIGLTPIGLGAQMVLTTVTDENGHFALLVSENARRGYLTVAAPGRTLQSYEVPLGDAPLKIEVAPTGGMLILDAESRFRLRRDGILISFQDLSQWMLAHGDPVSDTKTLRIPNLAPGHYELCTVAPAPSCAGGDLTPGGSLHLVLPH